MHTYLQILFFLAVFTKLFKKQLVSVHQKCKFWPKSFNLPSNSNVCDNQQTELSIYEMDLRFRKVGETKLANQGCQLNLDNYDFLKT